MDKSPRLALTFGKQAVNFTMDGSTSSKELIAIDRSNLTNNLWFTEEYLPGVGLSGRAALGPTAPASSLRAPGTGGLANSTAARSFTRSSATTSASNSAFGRRRWPATTCTSSLIRTTRSRGPSRTSRR
jgi:hypothetical protein